MNTLYVIRRHLFTLFKKTPECFKIHIFREIFLIHVFKIYIFYAGLQFFSTLFRGNTMFLISEAIPLFLSRI